VESSGPASAAPLSPLERVRRTGERLPLERPGVAAAVTIGLLAVVAFVALRPEPAPVELSLPRAQPVDSEEGEPAGADAELQELTVHAAGAVNRPGLYRLPAGSRVADLIEAAGGPAAGADLDQVNLASPLEDGAQVLIPRAGEPGSADAEAASASSAGPTAKVNLNTASAEELDALPGVGPATAEAIIEHRETRGRFKSVTDLLEVRGIGEAKLAKLRPLVRV
jgi:competence protein ComEA